MNHVSFPGLGIDNLEISRIAFSIGDFHVYWYGILTTLAVLVGMILASRKAPRYGLKSDDVFDYFLWLIPGMLIFARLYYVAFSWDEISGDLSQIFNTRGGGLAFYGGVIGGLLAFIIVSRVKNIKVSHFLDFIVPYVPLGQAIGRWGNFFNQEAFGTNTTLPWGMVSERTTAYLTNLGDPSINPALPVHPTFLYEFLGNMVIFGVLLFLRRNRRYPYQTTAAYLFLYGILRFFVEGIRTDALYIGNTDIRISQLLSLLMVLGSVIFAIYMRTRHRKHIRMQEEAVLRGEPVPVTAEGVAEGWPVSPGRAAELAAEQGIDPVNEEPPVENTIIDHTENVESDDLIVDHTDSEETKD